MKHYLGNNPNFVNKTKRGGIVFSAGDILTKEFIEDLYRDAELEDAFDKASTIVEKWNALRRLYEYHLPEILETSKEDLRAMIDPYLVDWTRIFSPIEEDAWMSIRSSCIPLYPQFPLGNFFIDFASPYLKVGVEMDGRAYHDAGKDRKRDKWMAAQGWEIFRIKGSECFTKYKDLHAIREMELEEESESEIHGELLNYFNNTSDGVFRAIDIAYFQNDRHGDHPYYRYAQESLRLHISTGNLRII